MSQPLVSRIVEDEYEFYNKSAVLVTPGDPNDYKALSVLLCQLFLCVYTKHSPVNKPHFKHTSVYLLPAKSIARKESAASQEHTIAVVICWRPSKSHSYGNDY